MTSAVSLAIFLVALDAAPTAGGAAAEDPAPAFPYDRAIGERCLREVPAPGPADPAAGAVRPRATAELLAELAAEVDEVLDGPWAPLWSDYSAGQAGGVGPAEWAFLRPGDEILALAQAAPHLDAGRRAKARARIVSILEAGSPTRSVHVDLAAGKPRSFREAPRPSAPWRDPAEVRRLLLTEAYAVWAFAHAFDAWAEARPCFDDLQVLRRQVEAEEGLTPAWKPEHAAPLTRADADSPEYRFAVHEALLSGQQDNYGYHGARQARARAEGGKTIFPLMKVLSSLVGHYRLARHYGEEEAMRWAEETFHRIAALALGQKASPFLWSDPDLTPEVGSLLREHAGEWLDAISRSPGIGDLPGYDWNGTRVEGVQRKRMMNPYTWSHAWGGQGEGVRPRSILGAFLVEAWLFRAPPERLAELRDIPWCKADLYYLRKLVTCIQAAEGMPER